MPRSKKKKDKGKESDTQAVDAADVHPLKGQSEVSTDALLNPNPKKTDGMNVGTSTSAFKVDATVNSYVTSGKGDGDVVMSSLPGVREPMTGQQLPRGIEGDVKPGESSSAIERGGSIKLETTGELFLGDVGLFFKRRVVDSFSVEIPKAEVMANETWDGRTVTSMNSGHPALYLSGYKYFSVPEGQYLKKNELLTLTSMYLNMMLPLKEVVYPDVSEHGISDSSMHPIWSLVSSNSSVKFYDAEKYISGKVSYNLFQVSRAGDYSKVASLAHDALPRVLGMESAFQSSISPVTFRSTVRGVLEANSFRRDPDQSDYVIPTITTPSRVLMASVAKQYHDMLMYHDVTVLIAYQAMFGRASIELPFVIEMVKGYENTPLQFESNFGFNMPCGVGSIGGMAEDDPKESRSIAHIIMSTIYDNSDGAQIQASFAGGFSEATTYIMSNQLTTTLPMNNPRANRDAVALLTNGLTSTAAVTYARLMAAVRCAGRGLRITMTPIPVAYVPHCGVLAALVNFLFAEVGFLSIETQVMLLDYIAVHLTSGAVHVTGGSLREALLENIVAPSPTLIAQFQGLKVINPGRTPMQAAVEEIGADMKISYATLLHTVYHKIGRNHAPVPLASRFNLPTAVELSDMLKDSHMRDPTGEEIDWDDPNAKRNIEKALALANMSLVQHRAEESLHTMGKPPPLLRRDRRMKPGTYATVASYVNISREDFYGRYNLGTSERSAIVLAPEIPDCDSYIADILPDIIQFASFCSQGLGGTQATWLATSRQNLRRGITAIDTFGVMAPISGFPFRPDVRATQDAPIKLCATDALAFLIHGAVGKVSQAFGEEGLSLNTSQVIQAPLPTSLSHQHVLMCELKVLRNMLLRIPSARRAGVASQLVVDYMCAWLEPSDVGRYRECCIRRVETYMQQMPRYIQVGDEVVHDGFSPTRYIHMLPVIVNGDVVNDQDASLDKWLTKSKVLTPYSWSDAGFELQNSYNIEPLVEGSVGMFFYEHPQNMSSILLGQPGDDPLDHHKVDWHTKFAFGANEVNADSFCQRKGDVFDPKKTVVVSEDIYSLREDPIKSDKAVIVIGGPLTGGYSYLQLMKHLSSNGKEFEPDRIDLTEKGLISILRRISLEVRFANEAERVAGRVARFKVPIGIYIHASTNLIPNNITAEVAANPEMIDYEYEQDMPIFALEELDGRSKLIARIDAKVPVINGDIMRRLRTISSRVHYKLARRPTDVVKLSDGLTTDMGVIHPSKGYLLTTHQSSRRHLQPAYIIAQTTSNKATRELTSLPPDMSEWDDLLSRTESEVTGIPVAFRFHCGMTLRAVPSNWGDQPIQLSWADADGRDKDEDASSTGGSQADAEGDDMNPDWVISDQSPVLLMLRKPSRPERQLVITTEAMRGLPFISPAYR